MGDSDQRVLGRDVPDPALAGSTAAGRSTPSGRVAGAARPRVYVHLEHGRSFERWAARYERGDVWEPSPYCYGEAADRVELRGSTDRPEGRAVRLLRTGSAKVLGFDVLHAWRNRAALRWADVVWTHTEHEHLAVAAVLRTLRRRERPRLVAQTIWMWDAWVGMSWPRRRLVAPLLAGAAIHTTLSPVNAAVARRALPGSVVTCVPYGTWRLPRQSPTRPTGRRSIRVLAPGNDRHRDWATLLAAARADATLEVRILARRGLVGAADAPANVTVTPGSGRAEILAAYSWADAVVVPVQPNGHASGITVGLEALNVGRPLVITGVGGVEEYFGEHAWYPPAGDVSGLLAAIHAAADAGRQPGVLDRHRAAVERRGLTSSDWVARHVLLTDIALGTCRALDDIASFAPVRAAPRP